MPEAESRVPESCFLPASDGGTKPSDGGNIRLREARIHPEVDAEVVQVCALGTLFILHQILRVSLASELFLCSCQILTENLASRFFHSAPSL